MPVHEATCASVGLQSATTAIARQAPEPPHATRKTVHRPARVAGDHHGPAAGRGLRGRCRRALPVRQRRVRAHLRLPPGRGHRHADDRQGASRRSRTHAARRAEHHGGPRPAAFPEPLRAQGWARHRCPMVGALVGGGRRPHCGRPRHHRTQARRIDAKRTAGDFRSGTRGCRPVDAVRPHPLRGRWSPARNQLFRRAAQPRRRLGGVPLFHRRARSGAGPDVADGPDVDQRRHPQRSRPADHAGQHRPTCRPTCNR